MPQYKVIKVKTYMVIVETEKECSDKEVVKKADEKFDQLKEECLHEETPPYIIDSGDIDKIVKEFKQAQLNKLISEQVHDQLYNFINLE